jgi:hypothetical protein
MKHKEIYEMELFNSKTRITFGSKREADQFLEKITHMSKTVGWATLNDILRLSGNKTISNGGDYGFSKKDIRKLKPTKWFSEWEMIFPVPGKLVRDINGYWTVEDVEQPEEVLDLWQALNSCVNS